jgi:hypothetical protein
MVAPLLTVRALATASEREKHCHFADQAFSREPSPTSARHSSDWFWGKFCLQEEALTRPWWRVQTLAPAGEHGGGTARALAP